VDEVPKLSPDLRREIMRDGFRAERRDLYGEVIVELREVLDRYGMEYGLMLMETVGLLTSLQHQLLRDGYAAIEAEEGDGADA